MEEIELLRKPKWRPRWKVTYWRAIFICLCLGGFGLHRLYMGQWKAALIFLGLILSSVFIEMYFIWPNQVWTYTQKEDAVLVLNVIFWFILIREIFLIRHFTHEYNNTETYPLELFD